MNRAANLARAAAAAISADKVSEGEGRIFEKTVSFGSYMMKIDNIATMSINKEENMLGPLLWTVAVFFGLIAVICLFSGAATGLLICGIISGLFVSFAKSVKLRSFLLIGTSDGKTLSVVSQNQDFLRKIQNAIASKMDHSSNANYSINIEKQDIHTSGGGVALGDGSSASGRQN